MSLKKCFLIGGAPLTGKSTYAKILTSEHRAVQISTDNIRDWMKKITNAQDYPRLFYEEGLDVESFYQKYDTPEKVLSGEIDQAKDTEKGIVSLLECYLPWEQLVIEGIAITPEFATKLQKQFPKIEFETTFLFDSDFTRIKNRVHQRGLWDLADTYPDYIKEKEIEWVVLYNEFYKEEAKKYNLPLTDIGIS
jgi:2-phosphoglycerate kinase